MKSTSMDVIGHEGSIKRLKGEKTGGHVSRIRNAVHFEYSFQGAHLLPLAIGTCNIRPEQLPAFSATGPFHVNSLEAAIQFDSDGYESEFFFKLKVRDV
jgi:hypothetical protein